MKKHRYILTGLLGGIIALSCGCIEKKLEPYSGSTLVFALSDNTGTRATRVDEEDESHIGHWSVLLYDASTDDLTLCKSAGKDSAITCYVNSGRSYKAYAVANYPRSGDAAFDPGEMTTVETLVNFPSRLEGNSADALVMSGEAALGLVNGDISAVFRLGRLACKIEIRKISLDIEDEVFAQRPFTLKGIYVTNACRESRIGEDIPYAELSSDADFWYNSLGWHGSGTDSRLDAMLGDVSINTAIPNGGSYDTVHCFYTYPNSLPADDGDFRCTKLVLETYIGSKTYYYPVTLPGMVRNNNYIITEARITGLGSLDPENETPGALDVSFYVSPNGWEGTEAITEES